MSRMTRLGINPLAGLSKMALLPRGTVEMWCVIELAPGVFHQTIESLLFKCS